MKKALFAIIAAIAMLCTPSLADDLEWPRSYFVEVGYGVFVSKGDFNERATSIRDTSDRKGLIHQPALDFFATPDFTIGANIAQFTLGLNFQYTTFTQMLAGFDSALPSVETDSRIWRLGIDFTYNIFWPEFFQIGLGIGYSFTNIKTEDAVYFKDGDIYDVELMGSAVNFTANLHYYFTDHIAIVPTIRVYENWFKNAYSSRTDNCDLDPYLWQTFIQASIGIQYTF